MFYHEHVHHKIWTTIFSSIFKCSKGDCVCYHEHLQQKIWTTIFKCLKGGCVSWLEAVSYPLLFTLLNGFSLAHTPAYCSIYPLHNFKVLPMFLLPTALVLPFTFDCLLFTLSCLHCWMDFLWGIHPHMFLAHIHTNTEYKNANHLYNIKSAMV